MWLQTPISCNSATRLLPTAGDIRSATRQRRRTELLIFAVARSFEAVWTWRFGVGLTNENAWRKSFEDNRLRIRSGTNAVSARDCSLRHDGCYFAVRQT